MELCNETATVFNARGDPASRGIVYAATVLRGVSWREESLCAAGERGLRAANRFVLRIPADVDAGGRDYAGPGDYRASPQGRWTLQKGDIVARGDVSGEAPGAARERGVPMMTVLGVSDNRRAPRGKHWRVTGE